MLRFEAALVGMHFRPPAKDVVNNLPSGAEMLAVRQPENPYDVNAISVVLPGFCEGGQWGVLRGTILADMCSDLDPDDLSGRAEKAAQLSDPLPLGYICNGEKTGGKKADLIAPQMDGANISSIPCKLTFNEKGGPMVLIEADFIPQEPTQAIEPETGEEPFEGQNGDTDGTGRLGQD